MDDKEKEKVGAKVLGTVCESVSNGGTLYRMDKYNTPRGHGFAAEDANHLSYNLKI